MFPKIYDELMSDIDYEQIYTFLKPFITINDAIIDAGCGSGYLLKELLIRGHDVIGIDADDQMLSIAQIRLKTSDLRAPLYHHDLRDALVVKADVIISFFDVMNYLKGVKGVFSNIKNALTENGKFIFDIYKESVLIDYDGYVEEEAEPFKYKWEIRSDLDKLKHVVSVGNQTHKLTQYVKPLKYYLDLLDDLGFKEIIVKEGPDIRKHYIIAML